MGDKNDVKNDVKGKFRYDQDSKRFHRFKIETEAGIVGAVYVPKDMDGVPKKIILEYAAKRTWIRHQRL